MHTGEIDQKRLFVIVGIGRSGTSLLQEIMNCFEDFCNTRESRINGPGTETCYKGVALNSDFTALEKYIRDHWTTKYFVEKTPNSIQCLPQLNKHFPEAHYIFQRRDPLKIALSQINFLEQPERRTAKQILREVQLEVKYKSLFKDQLTIRYEDMVKDIGRVLRKLEDTWLVMCKYKLVKEIMSRPSYSSKFNSYDIKELSDEKAIEMIERARRIWGYANS